MSSVSPLGKMSPYPILDSRPIDQWKVTELKEELKRRKLTTKGLKDDLIKRLDEALRVERENMERENAERERENAERERERENAERERENAEREKENAAKDADNGFSFDPQPVAVPKDAETVLVVTETAADFVDHGGNKNEKVDDVTVPLDINDSAAALGQEMVQEGDIMDDTNSVMVEEESVLLSTTVDTSTTVETTITVTETVVSEVALDGQDSPHSGTQEGNLNLNTQLESEDSKPQLESEDSKPQLENEGLKTAHEDDKLDSSASENQVSEVSPNLGFQVKYDSISTDSVSINEKIELKDNIIADNVKLELDVVKPEMVEPSSSNVVPDGGESHPMDVEEPLEKKASVEEKDDKNATNADMNKNSDCADVGYSEKLNLDRSSGDDSMEEDVLESKQFDSKYNSDEVGDRNEKSEVPVVKEESPVDVVGDGISTDNKDFPVENKSRPAVVAEKRKLHDQEAVANNEPLKRQRRWNTESLKVPEPQSSNITPTTTPKDAFQSTALKRNFSRSDSTASEDASKERVVPPSQKPTTNSLRIDRFLRPFTLKAVQELLGKTGTVTSFWMDHIKTHCYVTYSSVEEAVETRNAVYNLQWPQNGGRLLVAEFVEPQEVKMRVEAPHQAPVTPVSTGSSAAPAPSPSPKQPQPSPRQQVSRQQLPPPPTLPPPPPLSNPPPARERLPLPAAPPLTEKVDPPIVTLDDLFRKTKATPRIYYLPLSEEQVASKLAARGNNTKQ